MIERITSRLPKWPFLLADLLLVAVAGGIVYYGPHPLDLPRIALCLTALVFGGWFSVTPFLKEYHGSVKVAEANQIAEGMARLRTLDQVRDQIEGATARWHEIQEQSQRSLTSAAQLADRMAGETREFCAMLDNMSQAEKTHLKLEIEKLRRAEGDWLQTVVRILDQVFALNHAAVQSRQQPLISQIGQFQHVCRDLARRIGLNAFAPDGPQPYDAKNHQVHDENIPVPIEAVVCGVVAPGYTFQGRMVRKAVVALRAGAASESTGEVADSDNTEAEKTDADEGISAEGASRTTAAPDPRSQGDLLL
jgi:molecular chaperone GrpE (heat shock protein)